jgi:hypothetical protein
MTRTWQRKEGNRQGAVSFNEVGAMLRRRGAEQAVLGSFGHALDDEHHGNAAQKRARVSPL